MTGGPDKDEDEGRLDRTRRSRAINRNVARARAKTAGDAIPKCQSDADHQALFPGDRYFRNVRRAEDWFRASPKPRMRMPGWGWLVWALVALNIFRKP